MKIAKFAVNKSVKPISFVCAGILFIAFFVLPASAIAAVPTLNAGYASPYPASIPDIKDSLAASSDGSKLVVVDSRINNIFTHTSSDYGATWLDTNVAIQGNNAQWNAVAMSPDGVNTAVLAPYNTFPLYRSVDSSANWGFQGRIPYSLGTSNNWQSLAISSDGLKIVVVGTGTYITITSDGGYNWSTSTPANTAGIRNWSGVAASTDLAKIVATANPGYIYTSADGGTSWTERTTAGSRNWIAVTSSSNGTNLLAADGGGYLYTSADSGATWTSRTDPGTGSWRAVASSPDGTKLAGAGLNGYIYTSTDSGATWSARTGAGTQDWTAVSISSDGTHLAAVDGDLGYIYTSADSGATWAKRTLPNRHTWGPYISTSTMMIAGNMIASGGANSTVRGISYGLTASYTATTTEPGSFVAGPFTANITGLSCGTTYHYAAYATNPSGTGYSSDQTFTTAQCLPSTYTLSSCPAETRLTESMINGVNQRITGLSTTTTTFKNFFSTVGGMTGAWSWNPSAWFDRVSPIDFSGVSQWNNGSGNFGTRATLISPRHVVMAHHNSTPPGYSVYFVASDGTVVKRTIQNSVRLGLTDMQLGILDEDVPSTVTYYPLLAYTDFFSRSNSLENIPLIALDQFGDANIMELSDVAWEYTPGGMSVYPPFGTPEWYPYFEGYPPGQRGPRTGDSGSPIFFLVGNKPALGATFTIVSGGPNYGGAKDAIDAAMIALGGGYQSSTVDVSCFTKYTPISLDSVTLSLPENSSLGSVVGTVPLHGDQYVAPLRYSIESGNTEGAFAIDAAGVISVNNPLAIDYETNPTFNLGITVSDSARGATSTSAVVTVNLINDPNDSVNPVITPATLPVSGIATSTMTSAGTRGWVSISSSADGSKLAAAEISEGANFTGHIHISPDSGATWNVSSAPLRYWQAVTSSAGGGVIAALGYYNASASGQYLYISRDQGATWATSTGNDTGETYDTVSMTDDGSKMVLANTSCSGPVQISLDGGLTWTGNASLGVGCWDSVAYSPDGSILVAGKATGSIFISHNDGNTWRENSSLPSTDWASLVVRGQRVVAASTYNGRVYISSDGGYYFKEHNFNISARFRIVSSSDGMRLAAINDWGYTGVYLSWDGGETWTMTQPNNRWISIASNADGTKVFAVPQGAGENIYAITSTVVVPSVVNSGIASLSSSAVTLNGTVNDHGGALATVRGFRWGSNSGYGSDISESGSFGTGSFSDTLSGLSSCTTYHFAAYATNSVGTAVSSDQMFTTTGCAFGGGGGGGGGSYSAPTITASPSASNKNSVGTAPSNIFTNDLSPGDSGSSVRALQTFLNAYGFTVTSAGPGSPGHETDLFGPATKAALKAFQSAYGITPTGELGPITRSFIAHLDIKASAASNTASVIPNRISTTTPSSVSFTRDLYFGLTGVDVRTLQVFLNTHGYVIATTGIGSPGHETGLFGYATRSAVRAFQTANGITPNGTVGPRTRGQIEALR